MSSNGPELASSIFFAMFIVVVSGCGKSDPREETSKGSKEVTTTLFDSGVVVLDRMAQLESEADVTCWTSFRQLDWFIAEKAYGEFATLAKIRSMKAMLTAVWRKAGKGKGTIDAADIKAAVTLPEVSLTADQEQKLGGFANGIGLRNYSDYQKTAEHWRLVLATIQDQIYSDNGSLPGFSEEGVEEFANVATYLSLALLKESSRVATEKKSPTVRGEDVQRAHENLSKKLGLGSGPRSDPRKGTKSLSTLTALTKKLVEGKAKALRKFNNAGELAADLNQIKVAKRPITDSAAVAMMRQLQSFVIFLSSGFTPMRGDNFLSDGAFESAKLDRVSYLSEVHVQNAVMQLFPHHIENNGDVVIKYEPNPGPIMRGGGFNKDGSKKFRPFEVRMLDHQMNGVRDSAIHWEVLRVAGKDKPFAMDPFAAEYLSEVVSMMATSWLLRADEIAEKLGKDKIDDEVLRRVRNNTYVLVPPRQGDVPVWSKEKQQAKKVLMRDYAEPLFTDVKTKSGLRSTVVPLESFQLQDFMGAGVGVGDVNGDGYADVFLAGHGKGRLYENQGSKKGARFIESSKKWGLPDLTQTRSALFFDYEGDGDLDLLVVRDTPPSYLFENTGSSFSDITQASKIQTRRGAHSAAILDFDGDGDLDIYIGYYGSGKHHLNPVRNVRNVPSMDGRNGSPNQLWQRGSDGSYAEVAKSVGVADVGWTLAVGVFDSDLDGDDDLYLANDFGANQFYENRGKGKFVETTGTAGVGDRGSGMNVDVTDVNGDGRWDFYVTNIDMFHKSIKVVFPEDSSTVSLDESLVRGFQYLSGNKLYVSNLDDSKYRSEEHNRFEPGDRGWGWDAAFIDVDNDGDDDMYLTNGWVPQSYASDQKNQLFINDGGQFFLTSGRAPESFAGNSRSIGLADFDRDGAVDLLVANFQEPSRLLINRGKKNKWLRLRLQGTKQNPFAVGARITVKAGDASVLRQRQIGRGYLGQAEAPITIGLGKSTQADVEVTWPGGATSRHEGLSAGTEHRLTHP